MAGPLALRFLFALDPARWTGLGKSLGRWPEDSREFARFSASTRRCPQMAGPLAQCHLLCYETDGRPTSRSAAAD